MINVHQTRAKWMLKGWRMVSTPVNCWFLSAFHGSASRCPLTSVLIPALKDLERDFSNDFPVELLRWTR